MNWRIFRLFWVFYLLFAGWAHAATYVSGAITSDTTWTEAASPYVVSGISIASGATLTLEAGVIVKMNYSSSFDVNGALIANGTADNKVYFTSIADDSVAGDTNGDGSASSPQAGYWLHIIFNPGSKGELAGTVIRYGGDYHSYQYSLAGVYNLGGDVAITGSEFSNNAAYGIRQVSGTTTINFSDFHSQGIGVKQDGGVVEITNSKLHDNLNEAIQANFGSITLINNNFYNNGQSAGIINGRVHFTNSQNSASGNHINAFDISGIDHDQFLSADLPYIGLSIKAGAKVTLEPGVVVKTREVTVEGELVALGTADKKIYFTSIADDTVGGDTNGDGSARAPKPGDWIGVHFLPGSVGNFSNMVINYAGAYYSWTQARAGIENDGGMVSVVDSKILNNLLYGILQYGGSMNINHSEIANSGNEGIRNYNGSLSISQSSLHDNHDYGINNLRTSIVMAENNWWGDASGPHNFAFNPLGFGQEVSLGVDFTPWLGYDPINTPPKPDPVIIIPGILGSAQKNGVWVIDPILHTYDDLIATLEANGYIDGVDLFTFPYDWHQSNVLTALQLKDKINAVKIICQCQKIDLVAHSMGGLVARQYIQGLHYENDVDQLVFLGTPHLGAAKDYLTWEGGATDPTVNNFSESIVSMVANRIFKVEARKAGFSNVFEYVRNKPVLSVQQLLPIYDYLRDKSTGNLRTYPNNYPRNAFLENLKAGTANLFDRTKIINIVGQLGATSTINFLNVVPTSSLLLWEDGYPDGFYDESGDHGLERGQGDGTVPLSSSRFIESDIHEFDAEHSALVTKSEGLVFNKLTGKNAQVLITSNTDSIFDKNYRLLIIRLLSPVDMQITAPDGKRIGKDFVTGGEFNEIEGAFYSGFETDDEYITIPNPLDGEYKVETVGTGSGEYTVATGYISDNVSVDKDFIGQTEPGLTENLNIEVNNSNPEELSITPQDVAPPSINIISPLAVDYLRSASTTINVAIQDTETGIASSTILFDGTIVNSGQNIYLFFERLGGHQIKVLAVDLVGNATSSEVEFRVVATPNSTISDIERAYNLGWIGKKNIKDELISKLNKIIKLEKKVETREEKLPDKPKIMKQIERIQKTIDKILGKAFLKELEGAYFKKAKINEQAYNLLKEDINWMLNN